MLEGKIPDDWKINLADMVARHTITWQTSPTLNHIPNKVSKITLG
jgi:hypothetical protein